MEIVFAKEQVFQLGDASENLADTIAEEYEEHLIKMKNIHSFSIKFS